MTNGSCMTTTRRRLSCELGDRTLHDNSASSMAHGGSLPVLKRPRSAASATLWRWLLASRTSSSFSRWSRCGCSLTNAGGRPMRMSNVDCCECATAGVLQGLAHRRDVEATAAAGGSRRRLASIVQASQDPLAWRPPTRQHVLAQGTLAASHVRVGTSAMAECARRATPSLAARWVLDRHRRRRPSRCRT